MKKKYKDLIDCANAITDEEIENTDWLMPSDIDPFLNALLKCIYKYRHPEHEERVVTREDVEPMQNRYIYDLIDELESK